MASIVKVGCNHADGYKFASQDLAPVSAVRYRLLEGV